MDPIEKATEIIKGKQINIGRHKYQELKAKLAKDGLLSPDDLLKLESYEANLKSTLNEGQKDKISSYYKKLCQPPSEKTRYFKPDELLKLFIYEFEKREKRKFVRNDDSKNNILPLIYYFTKDKRFFNCSNIIDDKVNINGREKQSVPSFDKGLLIIGNFGNGKSSSMDVFHRIFSKYDNLKFGKYPANDVVEYYEGCDYPEDKRMFWERMSKPVIYFDDVKTERIASNYGKANMFKDVIEKREVRKLKTHITCNFKPGHPDSINDALIEFAEKYGSRVFDRLFSMFNILIFTGGSFRR